MCCSHGHTHPERKKEMPFKIVLSCMDACAPPHTALSFPHVGSGDRTQVFRLGSSIFVQPSPWLLFFIFNLCFSVPPSSLQGGQLRGDPVGAASLRLCLMSLSLPSLSPPQLWTSACRAWARSGLPARRIPLGVISHKPPPRPCPPPLMQSWA